MPLKPEKKLRDKWEKKLADSGFKEIEKANGKLRSYDANHFGRKKVYEKAPDRLEFFLAVTDYARSMDKNRPREQRIMELFGEGWKQKDIAREVNLHRWTVCQTIKKHKKEIKKRWQKKAIK